MVEAGPEGLRIMATSAPTDAGRTRHLVDHIDKTGLIDRQHVPTLFLGEALGSSVERMNSKVPKFSVAVR